PHGVLWRIPTRFARDTKWSCAVRDGGCGLPPPSPGPWKLRATVPHPNDDVGVPHGALNRLRRCSCQRISVSAGRAGGTRFAHQWKPGRYSPMPSHAWSAMRGNAGIATEPRYATLVRDRVHGVTDARDL